METLAYCFFYDCLRRKAGAVPKCNSFEVEEEDYTSKNCSSYGNLKDELGFAKLYSYIKCTSVFDRDFTAKKNNYAQVHL